MKSLIKYIYTGFTKDELGSLAGQTSYFLLMSFFPLLIFVLTVFGRLNLPVDSIYAYLSAVLPEESYKIVHNILIEVLNARPVNFFSLLLTFLLATKGVRSLIVALNKSFCEEESRNIISLWIASVIFTIVFVFMLILTLLLLVFGEKLGLLIFNHLNLYNQFLTIWAYLRYIITITTMVAILSFIYKHAPSCHHIKYRDILPGALFTTASWTLASLIFSYYVNNYNTSYVSIYGSLAGIFLLLVWLYISSNLVILGGEINAYIYKNKFR